MQEKEASDENEEREGGVWVSPTIKIHGQMSILGVEPPQPCYRCGNADPKYLILLHDENKTKQVRILCCERCKRKIYDAFPDSHRLFFLGRWSVVGYRPVVIYSKESFDAVRATKEIEMSPLLLRSDKS